MPREWNERQRAALERLAEDLSNRLNSPDDALSDEVREQGLAHPSLRSNEFSRALLAGGTIEVGHIFRGSRTPELSPSTRGAETCDVYWDTRIHKLYMFDAVAMWWIDLGDIEHYEWARLRSDMETTVFYHFSASSIRARGPFLLRRLDDERIEEIAQRRREDEIRRGRNDLPNISGRTVNIIQDEMETYILDTVADGLNGDMQDALEYAVTPLHRALTADHYLVITLAVEGVTVQQEVLCGPFSVRDARRELQSLEGFMDGRVTINRIPPGADFTQCTTCFRPAGYLHQPHCPAANAGG